MFYILAHKFTNIYEILSSHYNKILNDDITKSFENSCDDAMNQELLDICNHFSIENSIVTMAKGSALVAIKDQKEYFPPF